MIGAGLTVIAATSAYAGEARPWLCRDKPVFSSQQPMTYDLVMGRAWRLFVMQFSPGGSNDGFDIVKTVESGDSSNGHLAAGRYFAVALRNSNGNWICPGDARDESRPTGVISNLCFAADEGDGCAVKLTVRPEASAEPHADIQ